MDWIVRTRDQRDNRGYERRYDTEPDFVSGVNELLENRWQRIVSATLPSGAVLDEEELRQLISTGVPPLWEVIRRRQGAATSPPGFANCGSSRQGPPLLPFKVDPMNGREDKSSAGSLTTVSVIGPPGSLLCHAASIHSISFPQLNLGRCHRNRGQP